MSGDTNTNIVALVAGDMARFAFSQSAGDKYNVADLSPLSHNPGKLFKQLEAEPYKAYFIDILSINAEKEQIIEYLTMLRNKTGAAVVLFAIGLKMDNPLIESLVFKDFKMWVTSEEIATMREQMQACLAGVDNAIELAAKEYEERKRLEETVAPGHRTISFAGTCRGAGTTTQALQYAMHLQSIGYKVCYVEYGEQGDIKTIPSYDTVQFMDSELGYIQYKGLDMYFKPILVTANMRLGYDICVFDYGVLTPNNMFSFGNCTARVCVLGTKPWQFGKMRHSIKLLEKIKTDYCMPLISKADKEYVLSKLNNPDLDIYYPAYEPTLLLSVKKNKAIYRMLNQRLLLSSKRKK